MGFKRPTEQIHELYTDEELIKLARMQYRGNLLEAMASLSEGVKHIWQSAKVSKRDTEHNLWHRTLYKILWQEIPLSEVPLYIKDYPKWCQFRLEIGR